MRRFLRLAALYAFHVLFVRPVLYGIAGVRYRRPDLLPEGPCLVVANHNSHLDAAALMALFPLRRLARVHPVAAADYFGKSWFMRLMAMALMNGIPIERKPKRSGGDPLQPIADRLEAGDSLIFFPEGSRGEAGVVAPFRPGVGRLVQSVPGLLVVPVFLSGPERIWPRGNAVPVPLAIDVNVGRPRIYPADEEPRRVAELVRNDVLALAPPPPPIPGDRRVEMIRAALCGVDREAVDRVFRETTVRLGKLGRTLGLSETTIEAGPDGTRDAPGLVAVGWNRTWLATLAVLVRAGRRIGRRRLVSIVERAQIDEAIGLDREARFVVVDGNATSDLLAWTDARADEPVTEAELHRMVQLLSGSKRIPPARWARLLRHAPEIWFLHVFRLARPTVPHVLVVVRADPRRMAERLRAAGGEIGEADTEAGLERLSRSYERVADLLARWRGVRVVRVDPSAVPLDREVERVLDACRLEAANRETEGEGGRVAGRGIASK